MFFQCAYFLFFNLLQLAVFSFYYETPTGFRSYFTNLLIENTENIGKPDRQKQMNTIRSPWMYNSSN